MDEIAKTNQAYWEREVARGSAYTKPWLDITQERLGLYVRGETEGLEPEYNYLYPPEALAGVAGREVLLLGAGGGQQSAVFGLLGARVTVVDLCEGQLEGDRKAAEYYGYEVSCCCADQRDLEFLEADRFDLVYHANSLCFVPNTRRVYEEVWRVLRDGGRYRVGHMNPAMVAAESGSWDGQGYRIGLPYVLGRIREFGEESAQYRHGWGAIINDLVATGFAVEGLYEDPRHLDHSHAIEEGNDAHFMSFMQQYLAVLVRKGVRSKG